MLDVIGRREFIAALCGATMWPLTARAQSANPIPKIGWLKFKVGSTHPISSRLSAKA